MKRYKVPDKKNALSLINAAEIEVNFAISLERSEKSASTIVRNIYEGFRMLGDAILINEGISSEDHLLPINALIKLDVKTKRPLKLIDGLRKLRHNINYNGYSPSLDEMNDVISIAESCFSPLLEKVKNMVEARSV